MNKNPYAEAFELAERIRILERIQQPTRYQVALLKRLRKEFAIAVART